VLFTVSYIHSVQRSCGRKLSCDVTREQVGSWYDPCTRTVQEVCASVQLKHEHMVDAGDE